jgi:hypothetical protein
VHHKLSKILKVPPTLTAKWRTHYPKGKQKSKELNATGSLEHNKFLCTYIYVAAAMTVYSVHGLRGKRAQTGVFDRRTLHIAYQT